MLSYSTPLLGNVYFCLVFYLILCLSPMLELGLFFQASLITFLVLSWFLREYRGIFFGGRPWVGRFAPRGISFPLVVFLILVETFRIFVRPLTLSLRMCINITLGHAILGILNSLSAAGIVTRTTFFFLEIFVALIQAYIATLLLSVYQDEVHNYLPILLALGARSLNF